MEIEVEEYQFKDQFLNQVYQQFRRFLRQSREAVASFFKSSQASLCSD